MNQLLIASANPYKIREITTILQGIPYELKDYSDVGMRDDVAETGSSYEENARIKAQTAGEKFNILTLADDSGLEVDALDGGPGIHSARYAEGGTREKIAKLLNELSGIPEEKRTARYRSVVVLYNPHTARSHAFEGVCEGKIMVEERGTHGFGYDPVFYSFDLRKTFGEATDEEKGTVSHRERAIRKCREYLLKISDGYRG